MGGITVTQRFRIANIVLKLFRSDIQVGRHGGHLEILQIDISSQTVGWIEPKLDGKHHSDTEIQNC